jgi:hypothetical protein
MRLPRPQKLYPYGLAGAPHNDGAAVVRGGRADVVGRCVGATTRAVVGGWVVVGRAVVGGVVVVEAAVVGAAVVGGAVVVEATGRAAVLAGGVGGLATNTTRPSRDNSATAAKGVMICSLRYQGRWERGRGGGGAPHCGGVGGCWRCGGPHAGGRPGCGGGVDPAGGWAGGWLGCCGPQPCGFTHRSGTAGLPSKEAGCRCHYRRLRKSDRYASAQARGESVTTSGRPRNLSTFLRRQAELFTESPAVSSRAG